MVWQGSCMSGIIGTKNLKFSLIGYDVVTASQMEASGRPDHIHASEDLVSCVPDEDWVKCEVVDCMDGQRVQTYLLGA